MERPGTEVDQQKEPDLGRGILRGMGFMLMVDVISFVFGVSFFLIVHGLAMGMIRLAGHWQPAHRLLERLVLGSRTSGTTVRLITLGAMHLLISSALMALFIGFGVWFLVRNGFWGQNLIWIATH